MTQPTSAERFYEHVAEVERHWAAIQARKAKHREVVADQFARLPPSIVGTKQDTVVDRRCSQDPLVSSAKSGLEHNLKFALMYGLGAILEGLVGLPTDGHVP